MTTPKQVPCSGCGQLIFFARTSKGASMPVDARATCYRLVSAPDGTPTLEVAPDVYVSHFRTCKMASDFSRGGKKPVAPTTEGQCPPSTSTQPS